MNEHVSAENAAWLKHYPKNVKWDAPMVSQSLGDFFDAATEKYRDRPCIDFLGQKYTYGEIEVLVNKFAKGLQAIGVKKGTKVGLCLPNTPYSVICYFGALKAGATVVNFNPLYTQRELAFQIDDSETEIMVTMDLELIYPKLKTMLTQTHLKKIVVCQMAAILPAVKGLLFRCLKGKQIAKTSEDENTLTFERLTSNDGDYKRVKIHPETDIAVLQYTGGTSGTPKGAMLNHANISVNISQIMAWVQPTNTLVEGQEKFIAILPFFHVFAMNVVMNFGLSMGAELILLPRFTAKLTLKTIDRTKATVLSAVPTIFSALNGTPSLSKYDLSSLKYCTSGGAPLPKEVQEQFQNVTGCEILEGYGLSETSSIVSCIPPDGLSKTGSIGIPLPQTLLDIRALDNHEIVMPRGERGEICIRGPQIMQGYWRQEDETKMSCINGLFKTGDVGYMDEDGYIFIVDRIKDLIICSGYNVYPRNIEEAIYLHPFVQEVTVIGVDDKYRGESPKAFVKLHDGKTMQAAELFAFLKEKISKIEMPSQIEFRSELPKTMIGKLSKKELIAAEKAKSPSQ